MNQSSVFLRYFIFGLFFVPGVFSAEFKLKYATMAPQGSLWQKYSELIKHEIHQNSSQRIELKTYYGGIAGDEKTMGKKLRSGIIDIASFSGIGLGEILPSARLFELPMFFSTYNEVDRVVNGLTDYYQAEFKKLNLVLGSWGEGGFVYLMTTSPMNQFIDMKGMKVWAPSGDLIVKTMFQKYGFVPVFLGMESVLTQLQTGGVSAVYAPPMAAVGLQWYNEVSYIYNLKLTYSVGATLINKSHFSKLPEDLQNIILAAIKKHSRSLVLSLRQENDKTLNLFKTKNIKMLQLPESDITLMEKYSKEVQDELATNLYPKEVLEKARSIRSTP
jgi:TRAP-type C4-dicarboxylate transport system substrate-binding protein